MHYTREANLPVGINDGKGAATPPGRMNSMELPQASTRSMSSCLRTPPHEIASREAALRQRRRSGRLPAGHPGLVGRAQQRESCGYDGKANVGFVGLEWADVPGSDRRTRQEGLPLGTWPLVWLHAAD